MKNFFKISLSEPYRIFFPLGIFLLLIGILLWLPQIWNPTTYPVLLHRYLVLNGFMSSFIGGFLMTAVPRFSKTFNARPFEILILFSLILMGVLFALMEKEAATFFVSALQALMLLYFLFARITKRKENPPFSFIFIFVGLILWTASALTSLFIDNESFKQLHYEGSIAAIILGVGSRLIPGILGHVDIVQFQRQTYENLKPILSTVPIHFMFLIISFIGSYFLSDQWGSIVRACVVSGIGLYYWKLYKRPQTKTALTWCLWATSWFILLSFVLKAVWRDGVIHASHAFFISGIVLLSMLIATRVIQSHGPKDSSLENKKVLYLISFFVFVSASTRVSAYLMESHYQSHLGYSSLMLAAAIVIWSIRYLKYISKGI